MSSDLSERGDDGDHSQFSGPASGLVSPAEHHGPSLRFIQAGDITRIDLARTLFTQSLSRHTVQRLEILDHLGLGRFVRIFWISQCAVISLALIDTTHNPTLHIVLTVGSVVLALPALVVTTGSLSIKMVCLLVKESEFRCILVLSIVQWIAVAIAFRDARSLVCILELWVVLLAVSVDADFRLYARRLKPIATSTVVTLVYLISSLMGSLPHTFKAVITINSQTISVNDILQWTSPTLVLFLLKSMYHQRRQRRWRISPDTSKTITVCGSIVKIRLTLTDTKEVSQRRRCQQPGSPLGIPIVRSHMTMKSVDPTKTLFRSTFPLPDEGMGVVWLVILHTVGVVSFIVTCYGAIVCQVQLGSSTWSPSTTPLCAAALIGAFFYCGTTARYYNRQLLGVLLRTFYVIFSSLMHLSASLLLGWMYQWDIRCINLISWAIWFNWILFFDALTPNVRQYLSLKKIAVTPLVLFTLYGLGGPLTLLYGYTDVYLTDRELFANIRVSTLLASQILTLWLLNMRLVWDFGVRDDDELISITDLAEYTAPCDAVFARSARSHSRRSSVVSNGPALIVDALAVRAPSTASLSPSSTTMVPSLPLALAPLVETAGST